MQKLNRKIEGNKSIYEQVKEIVDIDGSTGIEEMEYIYTKEAIPLDEQVISSNMLCGKLIQHYKGSSQKLSFNFQERPIITFANIFMGKLNTLIQEEIIELSWIEKLTKHYVFESSQVEEVKLGLILSEKYLKGQELKEVVDTFTKSGEYIFYLTRAIKNISKCNSYIMEMMREAKGSIKVFAIRNIEILSEDINTYLFEEGYKDKVYEKILIDYVLTMGNMKAYVDKIQGKVAKINRFSYLIYNHLKNYNLKESPLKNHIVNDYMPVAVKGSNFITLLCLTSIWQELTDLKEFDSWRGKYHGYIAGCLKGEKWKRVFQEEIQRGKYEMKDIITVANYFEFKLTYEDLRVFFQKKPNNFQGYLYLTMMGQHKDILQLLQFFYETMDISKLTGGAENISNNNVSNEDTDCVILSILIKGCRDLYPMGKDLALKSLSGKINDIRNEAVKTLIKYKKNLTVDEKEIIKEALHREPNFEVRNKLKELCEEEKIEFISTKGLRMRTHVKDVYLLSINLSGSGFRNKEYVERELENSKLFYLLLEKDNIYDVNAIRIVGESGFVIGYVPKKDNFILSNLLRGGRYLYCIVNEYALDNNYIRMAIYLSYKSVIKEAETILKMMTSDVGDFEN